MRQFLLTLDTIDVLSLFKFLHEKDKLSIKISIVPKVNKNLTHSDKKYAYGTTLLITIHVFSS